MDNLQGVATFWKDWYEAPQFLALQYVSPYRRGPLAEAVAPYVWFPVTSAAVERSFSLTGLIDAKNRQAIGQGLREAAVVLYCNGDVEQRFSLQAP